mmetsp:Transcript_20711/g.65112  ORF Transcript_20711/g.65112 Transcript_20711/m.65112 type:complete len:385 (+) Transcript_20711:310-1464(+)
MSRSSASPWTVVMHFRPFRCCTRMCTLLWSPVVSSASSKASKFFKFWMSSLIIASSSRLTSGEDAAAMIRRRMRLWTVLCVAGVGGVVVQQRVSSSAFHAAVADVADVRSEEAMELTIAERARTTAEVGIASGGGLSTFSVSLGGCPWTSFADYVLDSRGSPVFLLRDSAEHSANLRSKPSGSLLALGHGELNAARPRVTLSGSVEPVTDDDERQALSLAFGLAHPYADELLPRPDFSLTRLVPSSVFYVGGFGVQAQWVDATEYADARADPVASSGSGLADELNSPRHENDLRVAATHLLDCPDADSISVAAVDSLGLDLRVKTTANKILEFRLAYRNKPHSVEDAKSEVNKLLQEAWEADQGLDFDGAYDTKPRVLRLAHSS